jgi:ribosome-associated protein
MEDLWLRQNWYVPGADLSVRAVRSSGPGGQNVNKVATKVELRFTFFDSAHLSEAQKRRLSTRYPASVTQGGEVIVSCDETRSQQQNLQRAKDKLRAMLLSIERAPALRRPTQPSRGQKRRRLEDKKRRALTKQSRQTVRD